MTASNTAFTVFSAIGFILSLIPLWWHLEAWNIGTCMYMIWTALGCLVHFVDSIVWNGNTINWAPVWCDIAIRIQIALAVAWPACLLCIIRRLHKIASPTAVSSTRADKRRDVIIDLSLTVGIPVLQMLLEYIVAGHRFNIVEDFGCFQATYNTPLAYVLVWSWPVIIGVISACYGALTVRAFMKRRKQFKDLISTNGYLTYSRYWRLVALAVVDFGFTLPIALRTIIVGLSSGVAPWISWADTHERYSRVFQFPRVLLNQNPGLIYSFEIERWAAVICAFVFFGFFGFADEAMRNYRLLASTVTKRIGQTTFTESSSISDSLVKSGVSSQASIRLPVFITKQTESKRDTFSEKPPASVFEDDDLDVHPYTPRDLSNSV